MQESNYLDNLNAEQRAAVEYIDGPELVIAGAGSGKTRVLTYKIAHLLKQGFEPQRIMALTFTNKAAREMKDRIAQLVDPYEASKLWMGTFHSIFLRILRLHADRLGFRHDFTIYDSNDSRSLIKLITKELGLNDQQYKPATVASVISNAKNALVSPEQYKRDGDYARRDNNAGRTSMPQVYSIYCERCRLSQAMDFDDILYYMNVLLRDNKDLLEYYSDFFEYILVDEYQDTNFAQSLIVNQLSQHHRNVCVVGDDAQSIYSFRGANIGNILNMNRRFPDLKTFKLERNYRSTQTIINAAGSLIAKNHQQIQKKVYSENSVGKPIEVIGTSSDYEEAAMVAAAISRQSYTHAGGLDQYAILYRTNAQSRQLEEALRRRNLPYRIYGGVTFYQRKEVKDAISYFRLMVNNDDDEALRRIINFPPRGIGDTTMKKIQAAAISEKRSLWHVIANIETANIGLNSGTVKKLNAFSEMVKEISTDKTLLNDAYAMGQTIYNRSGILAQYKNEKTPEDISKFENLTELLTGLKEFVEIHTEQGRSDTSMSSYLSEISLLTDQDTIDDASEKKITLMTIHAAKGLEFPHVYITGLEEDLFPSPQAVDSQFAVEEERRLFYVAITRAMQTLTLSYSASRFRNGSTVMSSPSRFLQDIDPQYLKIGVTATMAPSSSTFHSKGKTEWQSYPRKSSGYGYGNIKRNTAPGPSSKLSSLTQIPAASPAPTPNLSADLSTPATTFSVGDKVAHAKFGVGTVAEVITEPDPMVIIDFENIGKKKLLLRFAKLYKQ
jgi:DNA helicase-2/ATP-dependent DNA helicase PcrA